MAPMEAPGRRAVRRQHSSLVKAIKASLVLDELFAKNRISRKTFNEILEWKNEQDRARKILMVVPETMKFHEFLKLLKETGTDGQTIHNVRHLALTNEDGESSENDERDNLQKNPHTSIKQSIDQLVMKNVTLKDSQITFNSTVLPHSDQRTFALPVPGVRSEERRISELMLPAPAAPRDWQTAGRPEWERGEIFRTMLNTMLHDPDCHGSARYPCETYGFFTVDGVIASEILDRDSALHWEEKAIALLTSSIENGTFPDNEVHRVVFYTNWSPCPFCVQSLLRFLTWSKREGVVISLSVRVAALFHVRWPECQVQSCGHLWFALHDEQYLQGIQALFQHGVQVEAFTEESWRVLGRALDLPHTASRYSTGRQRTDNMVQLSLRVISESARHKALHLSGDTALAK